MMNHGKRGWMNNKIALFRWHYEGHGMSQTSGESRGLC